MITMIKVKCFTLEIFLKRKESGLSNQKSLQECPMKKDISYTNIKTVDVKFNEVCVKFAFINLHVWIFGKIRYL